MEKMEVWFISLEKKNVKIIFSGSLKNRIRFNDVFFSFFLNLSLFVTLHGGFSPVVHSIKEKDTLKKSVRLYIYTYTYKPKVKDVIPVQFCDPELLILQT